MAGLASSGLDCVEPLVVAADGSVVVLLPPGASLLVDRQQAAIPKDTFNLVIVKTGETGLKELSHKIQTVFNGWKEQSIIRDETMIDLKICWYILYF
jgi:hypothetical protein